MRRAPSLSREDEDAPDGELFWVIKHGLRLTAMPAFGSTYTDEEIWKRVVFLRPWPHLPPEEKALLQAPPGSPAAQPAPATTQPLETGR